SDPILAESTKQNDLLPANIVQEITLFFRDGTKQDEYLVKVMSLCNPYKAEWGKKDVAWKGVINYLKEVDEIGNAHGQEPLFAGVTVRVCQARLDKIFSRHKYRMEQVLNMSGRVPIETPYDQLVDDLYTDLIEHNKSTADSREAAELKRKRKAEGHALGAALRGASLDRAYYRPTASNKDDDSDSISTKSPSESNSQSLSTSNALSSEPNSPLFPSASSIMQANRSTKGPMTRIRIESEYKRRKRMANEVTRMREKLVEDEGRRHREVEATRQDQHTALMNMIQMGYANIVNTIQQDNTEIVKILQENNALLASLLQKVVDK
ncbi:hypothetical protein BGX23_004544, partial [Mortierella sp. AD031]